MIIHRDHLRLLKRGIFIFMFLLCLDITLVVCSRNFVAQARQANLIARHKMIDARSRLDQERQELMDRATYAPAYQELLKRNIIGKDRLQDWSQVMENIHKRDLVIDYKYTISPARPFLTSYPLDRGNYELEQSRMSIMFDLLHEGQLFSFLAALHGGISGLFIVDHCSIERGPELQKAATNAYAMEMGSDKAVQLNHPNLAAECSGSWLTMNPLNSP